MIDAEVLQESCTPTDPPILIPLPASRLASQRSSALLTPVVCDERAIGRLLEKLLDRAGLSTDEASRRMGVTPNTVRQYLAGRRTRPSLFWFVKLAAICGAKVTVEFPQETV